MPTGDEGGAHMAYRLQGSILEVCTCKVLCPCWIGEDPVAAPAIQQSHIMLRREV